MPRKPRVHFSGAVYHVIVRGNNKERIFGGEKDKQIYLQILKSSMKRFQFELFIYAIMDNHAHFVIRVFDTPLSKIMHAVQQSYARYHNDFNSNSGYVFEERYKAYLCDSDRYLLALLRYIHRNPLEAGITKDLQYPWSSHLNYCGLKKDGLVSTEFIHGLLAQDTDANPVRLYREFIEAQAIDNETYISKHERDFDSSVAEHEYIEKIFRQALKSAAEKHGIDEALLLKKSRVNSRISMAKKELIKKLYYQHQIPNHIIARLLSVSKSYISQVLRPDTVK